MSDPLIKVSGVAKKYKININNKHKEDTFSGALTYSIKSIFQQKRKIHKSNNQEFWALKNVNFDVNKGDRIGIIGHNGAGKSTLLKIFSRITPPSEGTIEIRGKISSLLEVGTGFHPELTGRENIYLNGAILGMTRNEINKKFKEIVEFSEIGDFLDTPVKRYSSGMYVRLAFAVAAHLEPDILIVDEVLAVGDMKFQQKCLGKMNEVSGNGRTVLYVSHNMSTVQQLCNRAIVMEKGQIKYIGDVEEAIKIYMENEKNSDTYMDFEKIERPYNVSQDVKMLDFEFIDKKDCKFNCYETMKFKIHWKANKNIKNIYMRLEIIYGDSTPAGMTTTKSFCGASKGQVTENIFTFNINSLAPGKYFANIAMYQVNEFGTYENLDKVIEKIFFEVSEGATTNNMAWLHRWWGHVKLPELEIFC